MLKAADEPVAVTEGQRVADNRPQNGDQSHHREALHHGAEDILLAHQATVEERQSGTGHQQNQCSRRQHPCVIAGELSAGGSGLGLGTGCLGGIQGLLEGGDLGLCGGSRGSRAKVRSYGQGCGRNREEGRKKQYFEGARRHSDFTPERMQRAEAMLEAEGRPPIRVRQRERQTIPFSSVMGEKGATLH